MKWIYIEFNESIKLIQYRLTKARTGYIAFHVFFMKAETHVNLCISLIDKI